MAFFNIFQWKIRTAFWTLISAGSLMSCLLYFWLDGKLGAKTLLSNFLQTQIDEAMLKRLMSSDYQDLSINPMTEFYLHEHNMLHFYHLPKRKGHAQFSEITSANRDSSYPLAPDFTVHIDYGADHVVIYEDFGPGCLFRFYLFPVLPREVNMLHSLTAKDLKNMALHIEIDGVEFKYSLQQVLEGKEFPFLHPLTATHARAASGLGSHVPVCYRKHASVAYAHEDLLPGNLLRVTQECSANDASCPVHIYSAVSRHKYTPSVTEVESDFENANSEEGEKSGNRVPKMLHSFAEIQTDKAERYRYESKLTAIAEALKQPETHGPAKHVPCQLTCVRMCSRCKQEIFNDANAGVISEVRMRVFQTTYGHPLLQRDWSDMLLSAIFDSEEQFPNVPLGWLFGATGSVHEFSAAMMGRKEKYCSFNMEVDTDLEHNFSTVDETGYFYFPMPYWKSASINLQGTEDTDPNTLVCYQFVRTDNHYREDSTGYLHASPRYYGDDVSGYRTILSVENSWGHVVASLLNVDNLRAIRNVPLNERWAMLQADHLYFVDHRNEPAMLGTGLEDYFSYAHGFALAENTTYAFVGNYYAAPKRSEPLTWHVYRLHVWDPVVFNSHMNFLMEGTDRFSHTQPARELSYRKYRMRLKREDTTESHLTLYYARQNPFSHETLHDSLQLGDKTSESSHKCQITSHKHGSMFQKESYRYLGQVTSNKTYSVTGRLLASGDRIEFTLRLKRELINYNHIVLRRQFYTAPMSSWNQRAKVWLNEVYYGIWFIPMGTFQERYSLREVDLQLGRLGPDSGGIYRELRFEIAAETDWNDIAYELHVFL